jgi:hypothetical protein
MEMTHPIPPRLSTQHSEESEESLAQTNLGHWEYGLKPREIKAEEWGQHAQNFRILYLTDGLKLDDVRRLMYTEHGFYATSVFPIYIRHDLLIDVTGRHSTNTGLKRYGRFKRPSPNARYSQCYK